MKKVIRLKDEAKYFGKSIKKMLVNKQVREEYEAEGLRLNIAFQLMAARKKRHLSQKALAILLHMPQQQISRIEKGGQNITVDMLGKIVAGLKAKADIRIAV